MAPKKRKSDAPLTREEELKIAQRVATRLQNQLGLPVKDHMSPNDLIRTIEFGVIYKRAIDEEIGDRQTKLPKPAVQAKQKRDRSVMEKILIVFLAVLPLFLVLCGIVYNNGILLIAGIVPIFLRPRGPGTYGLISLSTRVVDKVREIAIK